MANAMGSQNPTTPGSCSWRALSFAAAVKWQLAQKTLSIEQTCEPLPLLTHVLVLASADIFLGNRYHRIGCLLVGLCAGMIVASLPILSPLLVQAFDFIKGSLRSLTGLSSRTPAGNSRQQTVYADSNPSKQRRWPDQYLLSEPARSKDSQHNASEIGTGSILHADTHRWERPLGDLEEREE